MSRLKRMAWAAVAFLVWAIAAWVYLNVGADLRETAPESGIFERQEGHFEDDFYITVER